MSKLCRALVGFFASMLLACGPVAFLLLPIAALAQSAPTPPFANGAPPPTAAQWNSFFQKKIDYNPGGLNTIPFWTGSSTLSAAAVSGDCASNGSALNFRCSTLAGVAPGTFFSKNYGTTLTVTGPTVDVTNYGNLAVGPGSWTVGHAIIAGVYPNVADGGVPGSGTVNSGTAGQLAYYATSTNAVSGHPDANISNGALTLGASGVAGSLTLDGSSSGGVTIRVPAAAGSNTLTLPAGTTDFSATGGTSQVVKQTSAGGALTVGQLACSDLSNGATGCSTATGTSGATIPLLNAANTWSGVQTHNNSTIKVLGSSTGATTITSANAGASNFTLTLPAVSGTAVTTGDSNTVTLGMVAQSGANTMLGNWTGSTANVSANAMPSCPDTGSNHLNYVSGTGVTCGTTGGTGLVSTQTAVASADIRWTGLSSSVNTFMMVCSGLIMTSDGVNINIQVGEGGTPTWETSGYASASQQVNSAAAGQNTGSAVAAGVRPFVSGVSGTSSKGFGLTAWLTNFGSSSQQKTIYGVAQATDGSTYQSIQFGGQYTGDTGAATAVRLIPTSSTIASGQCSLFALAQ